MTRSSRSAKLAAWPKRSRRHRTGSTSPAPNTSTSSIWAANALLEQICSRFLDRRRRGDVPRHSKGDRSDEPDQSSVSSTERTIARARSATSPSTKSVHCPKTRIVRVQRAETADPGRVREIEREELHVVTGDEPIVRQSPRADRRRGPGTLRASFRAPCRRPRPDPDTMRSMLTSTNATPSGCCRSTVASGTILGDFDCPVRGILEANAMILVESADAAPQLVRAAVSRAV